MRDHRKPMPVARDIMNRAVTTFPPSMRLDDAWKKLSKLPFTGVPVVADGAVVGILSESDILHSLAAAAFSGDPVGTVADAMKSPVEAAKPTSDIFAMADQMRASGIRRLPVCEDGELLGILTVKDLDKALLEVLAARDADASPSKPAGAAWDPEASAERDRKR